MRRYRTIEKERVDAATNKELTRETREEGKKAGRGLKVGSGLGRNK